MFLILILYPISPYSQSHSLRLRYTILPALATCYSIHPSANRDTSSVYYNPAPPSEWPPTTPRKIHPCSTATPPTSPELQRYLPNFLLLSPPSARISSNKLHTTHTNSRHQQEAIGTHISSDPSWKTAATETKDAAVAERRAAKAQSEGEPQKNETMGKVEERLGGAVGCEGMVGEGKERQ